jgi:hypothetical protein
MSTYWGFYCKNCDKETETTYNHGEDSLNEIYNLIPAIKQIQKCWWWELSRIDRNQDGIFEFLIEHENHNVVLKNEYGKTEEIDRNYFND